MVDKSKPPMGPELLRTVCQIAGEIVVKHTHVYSGKLLIPQDLVNNAVALAFEIVLEVDRQRGSEPD